MTLPDLINLFAVLGLFFIAYLIYRLINPMECHCGFSTRFVWRLKRHIQMKHGWK